MAHQDHHRSFTTGAGIHTRNECETYMLQIKNTARRWMAARRVVRRAAIIHALEKHVVVVRPWSIANPQQGHIFSHPGVSLKVLKIWSRDMSKILLRSVPFRQRLRSCPVDPKVLHFTISHDILLKPTTIYNRFCREFGSWKLVQRKRESSKAIDEKTSRWHQLEFIAYV